MAKVLPLVRKDIMVDEVKAQRLMQPPNQQLLTESSSAAA